MEEERRRHLAAAEARFLLELGRPDEVLRLLERLLEEGDPALFAALRELLESGDPLARLIAETVFRRL
uniref:RC_I_1-H11 n=1 Tax=synthetic construct TaxID=32630 RepID=UPI002493D02E|nr:Chain 0, RC_I_1-H11 [synthetic construct]8F4X_1 Chain 1, RC_I_1-H11 [synthetic construct]8F4X_2 Chain 2, RC_I_1-H11 [synthetic construct]8F4X_3 Chain 3, RC_I_1-H11 [synthetic construct]8F4X_4 Chain 4, RC_I_1-H11 [synthetic construct]8F4X_5 Chain 5, RC_I_1-H11 [synthetic construct]8F4X_6 Chain 6, RC_I_1-H11 [synthetic construct]8F4X_7 Chain 7, RC_I_1-H11 [synthetic construct]8F4X_8 Chain 8, RC_I_1-H11 [synthetic construct]8F4X_9 Chain 9, RC_I_1-H11 [synthetic construct]8F4X_A Chain A, R